MRIALGIEYLGTGYYGWQRQENVPSIQATLETALSRVADHPVEVMCAGRTDAGVHGTGQVVHFDTEIVRRDSAWIMGTNTYLPPTIRVVWMQTVDARFHARFSATFRRYRYVLYNRSVRSAVLAQQVSWHHAALDAGKMHEAAQHLIGEHDFSSLRSAECQANSPVKTVHFAKVIRCGDVIVLDIQANGFLHHMVRNIMGVLIPIGEGKQDTAWMKNVLEAKCRAQAGVTADPNGLYLVEVGYPAEFALPKPTIGPAFLTGLNSAGAIE
jgi:tRNA pseudouridine38-40 synthase